MFFKCLTEAIRELTCELSAIREERRRELATKADVKMAEQRIIAVVEGRLAGDDSAVLEAVETRVKKLAARLRKLDAQN